MSDFPLKLCIIFVLYHSYDEFETFLKRQGKVPDGVRLIVIDNTPHKSIDNARLEFWREDYGISAQVAMPENLGYFGAANFAMQKFDDLYEFDYVAISNTDINYSVAEVFRVLQESATQHQDVGAIAPRLVHPDGALKPQLHYLTRPTRKKYERLVKIFSNYYMGVAHRLAADLKRKVGIARGGRDTPRNIFAPHGAFMIMTRRYFSETAGFEHPCFLFLEEVTLGLECERAGLSCIYEPNIKYSHDNHGVIGIIPSRTIMTHLKDAHRTLLPKLT